MQHQLIGYLLQALDADEVADVERALSTCAETQRQMQILSRALEPLSALSDDIVIPVGLSVRTCECIRSIAATSQPAAPEPDASPET
jgi:hypothetical protein